MDFYIGERVERPSPQWCYESIYLGYRMAKYQGQNRALCLVSTPIDSEIAGLISLGAIKAGLENPEANLSKDYYSFLEAHRQKLLKSEDTVNNNYWHLRKLKENKLYRFDLDTEDQYGIPVIELQSSSRKKNRTALKSWILLNYAHNWQIEGLPIPITYDESKTINKSIMQFIHPEETEIIEENLRSSHIEHILIGKANTDRTMYLDRLKNSGFIQGNIKFPLQDLLTLSGNEKDSIRRLIFIEEKTIAETKLAISPQLIIADGIKSIISADQRFPDKNIIGIVNRSDSAAGIEMCSDWLAAKQPYYRNSNSPATFSSNNIKIRLMEKIR